MNKSQFDHALQSKLREENQLDLNACEVKTVMDAAASLLLEIVANGETISVHKLGVFGSRLKPSTGRKVPYFKPSKKMRAICDELGLNAHIDGNAAATEAKREEKPETTDPEKTETETDPIPDENNPGRSPRGKEGPA